MGAMSIIVVHIGGSCEEIIPGIRPGSYIACQVRMSEIDSGIDDAHLDFLAVCQTVLVIRRSDCPDSPEIGEGFSVQVRSCGHESLDERRFDRLHAFQ